MASENQFVVKLKLAAETLDMASATLRDINGVDEVKLLPPEHLRITYDISQTSWAKLREQLKAIGAYSQTGLLARWRDGLREFMEQNTRDGLRHKPACCSKPPPRGGR